MIKKTILIVDDTFENLYLLKVILEEEGYNVIEANDGSEGLKKLYENNNVDLIISDILMPVMDGYLFCQACKNENLFKNIPFVFYTSTYTEKLDEEFALKLGAAQFLRKPIDHDEIILVVENIFSGLNKPFNKVKKAVLKTEDVFKLYNERLINKLEQKSLDLSKEIIVRKNSEKLLEESKKYLDNIIDNIGDPVFVKDDQSRLILVNEAFCKVFNLSKPDILGLTLAENVTEEERESFLRIDRQVIADGVENVNEETLTVKDNETRIVSTKKTRFIDENHEKFLIGVIRDITERKKAELELKVAKEFSENLILNLNEGLSVVNFAGIQIEANPALCKMLGFTKEELIGQKAPFSYWPPEEYDEFQEAFSKTLNGEHDLFELTLMRKNGERFPVTLATSSVKNNKGETVAYFATILDISERVKAQKLLESIARKSLERKNAILDLANLVGLDFNESLNKITSLSAKTLDVERVSVWRLNDDKTENHCKKLYNLKSDSFSSGLILKGVDHPKYFEQLVEIGIVSVNDAVNNVLTKTMAKDYLLPNSISSKISIAVNGIDGLYGIICFENVGDDRKWDSDEEEFTVSIANVVSLMIESTERKIAENKIAITNKQLIEANKELNILRNQLEQENVYLRNELDLVFNYEEMVYGSEVFSKVLTEVEQVAPTNATVLLLGESGTGKELIARAVHNTSLRNNKPLIKINCSAIPRELMESELFGHKKGSFTGAFNDKIGKFELADGGTLFLDEIGELPLDMQPKILRFLQEGEIEVVGGSGLKKLDVRIIAATNRNLKEEIEKKLFREDLFFRLNVFPIEVPPLRKRMEDIPLLVEHFVDKFNKKYEKHIKYISDDAMMQLKSYKWPGNIRELENLIERALIISNSDTLIIPGFETTAQLAKKTINYKNASLEDVQRNHILQVLEQCKWKIGGQNGASALLDLKPSTLRDKMTKLGIINPNKKS